MDRGLRKEERGGAGGRIGKVCLVLGLPLLFLLALLSARMLYQTVLGAGALQLLSGKSRKIVYSRFCERELERRYQADFTMLSYRNRGAVFLGEKDYRVICRARWEDQGRTRSCVFDAGLSGTDREGEWRLSDPFPAFAAVRREADFLEDRLRAEGIDAAVMATPGLLLTSLYEDMGGGFSHDPSLYSLEGLFEEAPDSALICMVYVADRGKEAREILREAVRERYRSSRKVEGILRLWEVDETDLKAVRRLMESRPRPDAAFDDLTAGVTEWQLAIEKGQSAEGWIRERDRSCSFKGQEDEI